MKNATTLLLCILLTRISTAQDDSSNSNKLSAKEFNIPASPVFDLMGVTPSQVTNLSDIKDFKVDWSFKSWRLNPNLALQAQPIWEIFYNRKNLSKYRGATSFMRMLSTLDISLGTVQNEDNDRRIGFAAKINLFRKRDPLMANIYTDVEEKYDQEKETTSQQINALKQQLDTITDILKKPAIREEIKLLEEQYFSLNNRRKQEINERVKLYNGEHWNTAYLNVAFGKIYTYQTDSTGSLKTLRLNRNTGTGFWLNGGFGVSRKIFMSGLIRSSFYEEQLNFLTRNDNTGEDFANQAVAKNILLTLGFNIRYGGPVYTFFAEFIHERKTLSTAVKALNDVFTPPTGTSIVAGTVQWNAVQPYTINIGGDWRINRNLIINYGVRCMMDKNFKTNTFTPVVNIACMMR